MTEIKESCSRRGSQQTPVKAWFTEHEYRGGVPTGRTKQAVSHLECPNCGKSITVDDSMDMPWSKQT